MKTISLLVGLLLSVGTAAIVVAQTPAVVHNAWTAGAPMPSAAWDTAVGKLKGQIYVVGGNDANGTIITNTQIYNPATNTWSTGVPLPTPVAGGVGAERVNNVLYVMGGTVDGTTYSSAVWAFDLKTKTWSSKAGMPIALQDAGVAVENGMIYVVAGGNSTENLRSNAVYSYNPPTDTWTEEAPLLVGRSEPSVGLVGNKLIGFTIVVADGYASGGDTESYDPATNTWTTLKPDPVPGGSGWRSFACTGGIGSKLYIAGGLLWLELDRIVQP